MFMLNKPQTVNSEKEVVPDISQSSKEGACSKMPMAKLSRHHIRCTCVWLKQSHRLNLSTTRKSR